MKRFLPIAIGTILAIILSACSILQAIKLKDCEYSYSKISDVKFLNMSRSEMLSISGMARVTQALLGKADKVPLGFTVYINVHNPNNGTASMDRLFYTVQLDTITVAEGNNTEAFIVAGNSNAELPLKLNVDLKSLLQKQSGPTLGNAVKNFIGVGDKPTLVTINLKPVIRVAGTSLGIPRAIPLTFEYGGKEKTTTK